MKFFITGTDTGVGKTYVTVSLIKFYMSAGYIVRAIKPVETGCVGKINALYPEDAGKFAELTKQPLDQVCVYKFKTPVAPYVASQLERVDIDLNKIKSHVDNVYNELVDCYGKNRVILFIEGAGGLMVPVTKKFMMIDFPILLDTPVILVARLGLGTINHTLLSLEALERRNIPVKGVILNNNLGLKTVAELTNEQVLKEYLNVPILTVLENNDEIKKKIL
ncbi:MAG: dethiobiotin synthase [Proteobacteria bacterium]|nr:dethiobiotin synthase [Pseudomonadota bacterium]